MKDKAKELFLEGVPIQEIAARLAIPASTIRGWAGKVGNDTPSWHDLLDSTAPPFVLSEAREVELCRALILATLRRSLLALDKTAELVGPRELVGFAKILLDLGSIEIKDTDEIKVPNASIIPTSHPFMEKL